MNKFLLIASLLIVSALPRASHAEWSFGTPKKSSAPTPSAQVLDLCQIPPPVKGGVGFSQQRLVIFELDGESITHGPERQVDDKGKEMPNVEHHVFRSAQVHDHLRNVFFGAFPMERFHTVVSQVTAPVGLHKRASIPHAEMIRAAALDQFAAYSIACADWVMFPRVTKKTATWRQGERERTVREGKKEIKVKYKVWELANDFELEVDAYQFEGQSWRLIATAKADAGLMGAATAMNVLGDSVNQIVSLFGDEQQAPAPLSAAPELTCRVPLVGELKEIADSYGKCGEATLTVTSSAKEALQRNPTDGASQGVSKAEADEEGKRTDGDSSTEGSSSDPSGEADEDDEAPPAPTLDERTREALEVASSRNPRRSIEDLTKQELGEQAPEGMVEAVGAAKAAVSTCSAGADAVIKASQRLRSLVTQAPTETVKKAALGFAACAGIPLTYDLGNATPPGTQQLRSEFCKDLDNKSEVTRGFAAMHDVALCVGRVSGELSTVMVQNETKMIPGIKIEVPLLAMSTPQDNRFGLAIGKTEGAKRGDVYVAKDVSGGLLGFGAIVQQGPGGAPGARDPSHYRFRAGEAPVGTNMEEYPKVGLLLGARPQVSMILLKDELSSSMLVGGALEAGYNAGQFVGIGDEFWVRTNLAILIGEERETFVVLEFVPEAQYYLFNRVAAFVQSGMSYTVGTKRVPGFLEDVTLRGGALAVVLGFGLDIAVTPNWNTRLGVTGSQGITELTLKDEDNLFVVQGGRLSTVQGTVSVDYSF